MNGHSVVRVEELLLRRLAERGRAAADQDAHGVASKGRLEANDFSVPGCCAWALNEESSQSKKEGRGMPPATANLDLYCSLVASNFGIASSYERKNSV